MLTIENNRQIDCIILFIQNNYKHNFIRTSSIEIICYIDIKNDY